MAAALLAMLYLNAGAQTLDAADDIKGAPMASFVHTALTAKAPPKARKKPPAKAKAPEPLLAGGPPAAQRNAQELVKGFAPEQRAPLARAFAQSLAIHQQTESRLGLAHDDVAGAMAAFLVGNYTMHAGAELPDAALLAVAAQLRSQPGLRDTFRGQDAAALRDIYEQLAMTGTFMTMAWKTREQQGLSAQQMDNLRAAARANLKQVMGIDAERLRITERGASLQ
jgi:hypothetical protein